MQLNSLIAIAALAASPLARASVHQLQGSDTLAGVMVQAITNAGLGDKLSYTGGGSGLGEKAIINKTQGIAAMSRAFKADALTQAHAAGVQPIGHVIGLDGVGVFTNKANTVAGMSIDTLKKIYTCELIKWEGVPGSSYTGAIKAYRRNDNSGTTDTFKSLVGITAFGACVTVVAETSDIAHVTSTDALAVGYAGLSGRVDGNKNLAVAKDNTAASVLPTVATIRSFTYPLARKLYVYEASGSSAPNAEEKELLNHLLDRSFLDPILQDNDFFTLD